MRTKRTSRSNWWLCSTGYLLAVYLSAVTSELALADTNEFGFNVELLADRLIFAPDQSADNQSSLDYSTFDEENPEDSVPALLVSNEPRPLWRRQAELEPTDYESYRPSDFPLATPAALQSDDVYSQRFYQDTSNSLQQLRQQQQQQQGAKEPAMGQKMGPQFIKEPPSFIHYLNSSDLVIPCSASGAPQPTISWWHKSSQLEVGSLLDRRYVRYDNSLVISAFKATDYEPDIHSTTYKCQASNALGTIVSRDVVINAVIDQDYKVSVADQFVTVDNDAIFKCQLAPQTRDLFQVVGWLEDGQHLMQSSANILQLANQSFKHQSRTLVLPDGQLYIQRVQLKDTNKSYRCQIKNLLNSALTLSAFSGRLFVTDANEQNGASARIVDPPRAQSGAKLNEQLLLTCLAQGFPRPTMRWFRQQQQGDWIELSNSMDRYVISQEGNLLLIKALQVADNKARFRCAANNTFGAHSADTELNLDLWPSSKLVELEPKLEFISNGDLRAHSLSLNCTIRASSQPLIGIDWLRNGRTLFSISLAAQLIKQENLSMFDELQELSVVEHYLPLQDEGEFETSVVEPSNQSNFMLTSSSLTKLSLESEHPAEVQSVRRLRQKLRLSSKDSLLYQLQFEQLKRSDRGSYQCFARYLHISHHSISHLLLKDNPPKFVDAFASQLIKNYHLNSQVSLKCVASGSPLPEISWTLSGFSVPESSRFRVGDYVTRDGLIVSFVNISNVQAEDGGLYECSATNDVGQLRHFAWLNVTGQPYIRPMPNVSAIAGQSLIIMCPVGGWPIEQIGWFQNATKLPVNHRQKLFPNGTLLIGDLNEVTDSGEYSCQAKSGSNDFTALNHLHVTIKVPPVVEPFSFPKSLHRGQRYNIMCTVVRGDLPVTIRWFKDGRLIETTTTNGDSLAVDSSGDGLAIKYLDPYSSTLTFGSLQSYHRGSYSCEATNEAGRANQSSSLVIHVPPEWRIEPKDASVTVGKTAVIDCQADSFPAARIEWRLSQDLFREPPTEFKPIISSLYMRVFENGSLIIYNTQRTDAGYYLCQANNGVGPGLSRVIKLTVQVAAHFKAKIRTELVRRSQPARLRCESIGDPPIEISWLRDKTPLYVADEPRYSIVKTQLQDGIVSELSISETDRSDSALFTCITQNQFGNDDTNIQLIVQAPPDPPLDIRIHEYEARSVKISWLPGYSGNSPISKYIVMYAQAQTSDSSTLISGSVTNGYVNVSVSGNETSLILQSLIPLTEYQFYMFAINSLGSSKPATEPIKFRTDDEAPSGPPLFVKAIPISSRAIKVRWRAPERRAHFGSISGFYVGYKQQQQRTPDTFIYKTVEFGSSSAPETANKSSINGQLEQECLLTGLHRGRKYLVSVQAFNGRGAGPASEPALAETWRVDVPDPPTLRLLLRSARSVHLAWRPAGSAGGQVGELLPAARTLQMRKNINDHIKSRHFATSEADTPSTQQSVISEEQTDEEPESSEPILGYLLSRRPMLLTDGGAEPEWGVAVETRLPSDHLSQIVDKLTCGSRYQFSVAALNSVGLSQPSDPLVVKTEGSAPVAPDKSSLLTVNGSSALINLSAWHNGACTMRSFDVMFKPSRAKKWTPVTNYQLAANESSLVEATQMNQLVQRSTQSQQVAPSNNSILIDSLTPQQNYDLKIVATNEAGATEALYTFSTISTGKQLEQDQWSNGDFQLASSEQSLADLLASAGPLLPWLLFLLFLSLALSTGCILIARRRHAPSSSCSLSLSSASRSNQSSSNYYAPTTSQQLEQMNKKILTANQEVGQLNQIRDDNKLGQQQQQQQQQMQLADVYARAHLNPIDKSNYAYLSAARRPASPHNTDITSLMNGSDAEMCLGASALNIATNAQNQEPGEQAKGVQNNYYMAPMLTLHAPSKSSGNGGGSLSKAATLPANCHQQILQQLIQQPIQSQQMIDTLNMIQQQCATTNQAVANEPTYLAMQANASSAPNQADITALLEQQLQQQVYATVKRGCPRPPRLCDYTIYQCPNNPNNGEQDSMALMRCCELQQQSSANTAPDQQQVCYHQTMDQQQICLQHQSNDYQQLRPIN